MSCSEDTTRASVTKPFTFLVYECLQGDKVVVTGKLFLPSLILASQARVYPDEASFRFSTQAQEQAPGHTRKHNTRLEKKFARDTHSKLLPTLINYRDKLKIASWVKLPFLLPVLQFFFHFRYLTSEAKSSSTHGKTTIQEFKSCFCFCPNLCLNFVFIASYF